MLKILILFNNERKFTVKKELLHKYKIFLYLSSYYWERILRFISYLKYILKKTPKHSNNNTVLLDTQSLTINRRLAQVVLQLKKNGYDCRLKTTMKDYVITSKSDYSDVVFNCTNPSRKDQYNIVICAKNNTKYHNVKKIVFDDDINNFPLHIDSPFFYPLSFHVNQILSNMEDYIKTFDSTLKPRIGALFIGNTDPSIYNNEKNIHSNYGMHTRIETLDYIRQHFAEHVFEPKSMVEFNEYFTNENLPLKNKIVIIDKFFIRGRNYFDILGSSVYHIWTCGDLFPYCHNQLEGMASGAIPICEKYHSKPLYTQMKHNINCFCYDNLDELGLILEKIICNYSEDDLKMRNATTKLYNDCFSLSAFNSKLSGFLSSSKNTETYYIHPKIYK